MTKQERATAELQAIAVLAREFAEKYGYTFTSIFFTNGSVSAWTPHNEPDRIEVYLGRSQEHE